MASVLTIISSPSWLRVWEIVEAISIVVIGIGCAGEVWADHHKFADAFSSPSPITYSKDKWRRIFGMMVVGGLVIELFAFGLSFLASNREIEGLHKANLELQAKLQPRIITKKQISDFIFLTEKISKKCQSKFTHVPKVMIHINLPDTSVLCLIKLDFREILAEMELQRI